MAYREAVEPRIQLRIVKPRKSTMKYCSAILAVGLAFASGPAASQTFSRFVGFGDSTIDSVAYRVLASPGGGANFNALWPGAV
jgi:hypothetical protein